MALFRLPAYQKASFFFSSPSSHWVVSNAARCGCRARQRVGPPRYARGAVRVHPRHHPGRVGARPRERAEPTPIVTSRLLKADAGARGHRSMFSLTSLVSPRHSFLVIEGELTRGASGLVFVQCHRPGAEHFHSGQNPRSHPSAEGARPAADETGQERTGRASGRAGAEFGYTSPADSARRRN